MNSDTALAPWVRRLSIAGRGVLTSVRRWMLVVIGLGISAEASAFTWSANGVTANYVSGRNFAITLAPGATSMIVTASPGADGGDHAYMRYTFNNSLSIANVPGWWASSQNPSIDWTGDATWEWRPGNGNYTKTITGFGQGTFRVIVECQNYNWSNSYVLTVTVPPPNVPPTVEWAEPPRDIMYKGTWYPVRARGKDANGNLGGVVVQVSINEGDWLAVAWDPVSGDGAGSMFVSNNNGIVAGSPNTRYRFRAWAWDGTGATSSYLESGVHTITNRPPSVSHQILDGNKAPFALNGGGRPQAYGSQQFYVRVNGSDPDGELARLYSRVNNAGGAVHHHMDVGVSGANYTYDFGPYNTGHSFGIWDVWTHAQDSAGGGYQDYGGSWWLSHAPDLEVSNRAPTASYHGIAGNGSLPNAGYTDGTMAFWGTASDPDGNLSYVDLYIDGLFKARIVPSENNWSYSATSAALGLGLGTHSTYVVARDAVGGQYQTGSATFTIQNRPPTGSLQLSTNTASVGGSVTITLTASDVDGNVDYLNLWVQTPAYGWRHILANNSVVNGGDWDRTRNVAPSYGWSGTTTKSFTFTLAQGFGTYRFRLGIRDTKGEIFQTDSAAISYHVTVANRPPTGATITSATSSPVPLGGAVSLTSTVSDPDGNLSSHRIEFCPPGGAWTSLTSGTPSGSSSSSVSGSHIPTSLGVWRYRGVASDGLHSAATEPISIPVIDGSAPTTPGNLAANGVTAYGFTVSWSASNDNVGVASYEVQLGTGAVETVIGGTSKTYQGLSRATAYSVKVRAKDAAGNTSPWSNSISVTTLDDLPPEIPTGLIASEITATSFKLSWSKPFDNVGVVAYQVMQGEVVSEEVTATFKVIGSLTTATTYQMKVRAKDAAGNWSNWSAALPVETLDNVPPSKPDQLDASSLMPESFVLNWVRATDNKGVVRYDILRNGTKIGEATDQVSYAVTGLESGKTYSMKVRAFDAAGNSNESDPLTVTTPDVIPPTPPGALEVNITSVTADSFVVTWTSSTDNVAVAGYKIAVGSTIYDNIPADRTWFLVTGLASGVTYQVNARARDASNNWSDWSETETATTLDNVPPSPPTHIYIENPTDTSFELHWEGATDNVAIVGFEIAVDDESIGTVGFSPTTIGQLNSGQVYGIKIRAQDDAGNWSSWSEEFVFATLDVVPPSVPTAFDVDEVGPHGFVLSWAQGTDNVAILDYEVRVDGATLGFVDENAITVANLESGRTYSLEVRAWDTSFNFSDWSVPFTVTTLDDEPPSTPTDLVSDDVTGESFVLRWGASSDNVGVVEYEVARDGVVVGFYEGISAEISELESAQTYAMTVRAWDEAGNSSAWSAPLLVTTDDIIPPSAPTGLSISNLEANSLKLSWNPATDNVAVAAYEVRRDGISVEVTTAVSLVFTNLTSATTYTFAVRAIDDSGNLSEWSSDYPVTTPDNVPPSIPQGLAATDVSSTSLVFSWSPSTDNVGVHSYEVFRDGVSVGTTSSTSMAIGGLTAGGTYGLSVRARDQAGNWSVASQPLVVTSLLLIWPQPESIVYGTPLTNQQLCALANVGGSFVYSPSAGTVLNAGSHVLQATFVPSHPGTYSSPTINTTVVVTKAPLTVTTNDAERYYGYPDPAFTVRFSGFVNGDTETAVTGQAEFVTDARVESPIKAYFVYPTLGTLTSANYEFASFQPGTLTIVRAPLTVTAHNKSRTYGGSNPAFTATITGFRNGETAAQVVTGTATFSTNAQATSPVNGSYWIRPAKGSLEASNYSFGPFVDGALSITKAALKVIANDAERYFEEPNPEFSARYEGFQNGENASVLSGSPALTTPATQSSAIGTYPIYAAAGTLESPNYTFTEFIEGTLKVRSPNEINFPQPPDKLVGYDGAFQPFAQATSGLPVTFQILSGPASASGQMVTLTGGTGTVTIRALQTGGIRADGKTVPPADPVDQTFKVFLAGADEDNDGFTNKEERDRGSSMTDYDSRTSTLGQTIPAGWPNIPSTTNTKPVGFTAGQLSVDKSGALTYSVPIWVSPGTAGMQPQIALNYSSQAGQGIAGFGWSLSGVSTITRGPQTIPIDGKAKGVSFTSDDRYYLDGQRLIAISNADGGHLTEYRTEVETFSKIVSYSSRGSGPEYFKVWTKAGLILEFGNTTDSRIDAEPRHNSGGVSPGVLSWSVSKISDTAGNYMSFVYNWDEGAREQTLKEVSYTGNEAAGVLPYAKVEFEYELREDGADYRDKRILFTAGSRAESVRRLKKIKSSGPSGIAKIYTLGYIQQPVVSWSLLDSITEADAAGNAYEPLKFSYSKHETSDLGWEAFGSQFHPKRPLTNLGSTGTGYVDVNGDGRPDLLAHRQTSDGLIDYNEAWINLPSGFVTNSNWNLPSPLSKDLAGDQGSRFVDVNGDGRVDYIKVHENNRTVWLNNGDGWTQASYQVPTFIVFDSGNPAGGTILDVNGDGLPDIVMSRPGTNGKGAYINTGSGWSFSPSWALNSSDGSLVSTYLQENDRDNGIRFVDLNGDGLPDVLQKRSNADGTLWVSRAWLNTGAGWASAPHFAVPNASMPLIRDDYSAWGVEFADVNGDGLPDVIGNHDNNSDVSFKETWLNTGDGWYREPRYDAQYALAIANGSGTGKRVKAGAAIIDLTRDGLPELIWLRGPTMKGVSLGFPYNFHGGDVSSPLIPTGAFLSYVDSPGNDLHVIGSQFVDIDADGAPDIVWNIENGNMPFGVTRVGALRNKTPKPNLLTSVTNGFGVKAEIEYVPLTARESNGSYVVYEPSSSIPSTAEPGAINTISPIYVVKTVTNEDGEGGTHDLTYQYGGLRAHRIRGSLGFETMSVTDDRTGIINVTAFRQDYPYVGMPKSTATVAPAPNGGQVTISASTTTYATKLLNSGKTRFVFAKSSTSTSRDLDGNIVAQSTTVTQRDNQDDYDNFGNSKYVSVDTGDGHTKVTESVYSNDTANGKWLLGRLTRSQVTSTSPAGTIVRKSAFAYDDSTGFLKEEIVEPNFATLEGSLSADDEETLRTAYEYDAFGNKTKATVSGVGVTSRITTTKYTSNGRFPEETTNAEEHKETYTYDPTWGTLKSLTGPNNLTTTWEYDTFGAKIKETRSDTTVTEIRTRWIGSRAPDGAHYFVETESQGAPPTITFHDNFGRAFQSLAINGAGHVVYQDTVFDNMGRTTATSVPYRKDGSPKYWAKTTAFDVLNRPLTSVTPDDHAPSGEVTTTFSYQGLTTEATDPKGRVTKTVKNRQGQVVETTRDAGGANQTTVTFGYDALGNLTTTNAAGAVTTLEYDVRGRKKKMVDPDMGTWTYKYNAFGELKEQTDAKNQTTTMTYDRLGRMKTRIDAGTESEAERTTTWTYDTADNGKGKLHKVESPGGYVETYSYDGQGRVSNVVRKIDGQSYSIGQTYDSYSRPEKTVYPNGFQTKNVYSLFGAVKEVRRADSGLNTLYWKADRYAVTGTVDGETFGNGVTADRIYSPATGRLMTAAVGLGTANHVQYLQYTYDVMGNVVSRIDSKSGREEYFTFANGDDGYDRLDRLMVHRVVNGPTVSVTYNAAGNITSKSDVGTYTYGGPRPHAVTSAGGHGYDYDANGNMISGAGRTLTWTSFNQVKTIVQGSYNTEFFFGAARERVRQVAHSGTTIYVGGVWEKFTKGSLVEEKNYVMAPTGRVAVVKFGTNLPVGGDGVVNYFHTDGLGSTTAITDADGDVVKRFAFDAWGKRLDLNLSTLTPSPVTSSNNGNFTRGYTDHEHLDDFNLIHMNGRVYDPVLGRFLSADPHVDGAYDSQGYNRYSYVGNNPMNATDPSGYFKFKDIIPAIVGIVVAAVTIVAIVASGGTAITGVGSFFSALKAGLTTTAAIWGGAAGGFASGFSGSLLNGGSIGDAFKAGVIGAAVGAATAWAAGQIGEFFNGLDGAFADEMFSNWAGRTVAHGVVGGAASEAQGGSFRHGFLSSAASAGVMHIRGVGRFFNADKGGAWIAARTAAAATIGGTASVLGGGKFANGAVTSAFQHLFNNESGSKQRVKGQYVHEETVEWYEQFAEESWITNRATILVGYDVERVDGIDTVVVRDVQLGYNWMDGKKALEEINAFPAKFTAKLRVGYRHELTVDVTITSMATGRASISYQVNKYFYAYGRIGASKATLKTPQKRWFVETANSGVIYVDPPRNDVSITLAP